jgi:hypothetical protein
LVVPGLDPGIHDQPGALSEDVDGRVIGERTPFFERLCPPMTKKKIV